jgi:hypothetical protein
MLFQWRGFRATNLTPPQFQQQGNPARMGAGIAHNAGKPAKEKAMILGHDFKYSIPEMDRLLGVAADLGIHFDYDSEDISFHGGRKYLIQIVNVKRNDTHLQLMVSSYDVNKREEKEIA